MINKSSYKYGIPLDKNHLDQLQEVITEVLLVLY
jgi:hypothetical protein